MLPLRLLFYFVIILFILSYCCEAQNEIRNAVKTKTNRKIKEGNQKIQRGKKKARKIKKIVREPFDRAGAKITRKYQTARRKIQAIEEIIQS